MCPRMNLEESERYSVKNDFIDTSGASLIVTVAYKPCL